MTTILPAIGVGLLVLSVLLGAPWGMAPDRRWTVALFPYAVVSFCAGMGAIALAVCAVVWRIALPDAHP